MKLFTSVLAIGIFVFSGLAHSQTVMPGTRITSQSFTAGTAAPTAYEQFVQTAGADTSKSLQNKYITFCLPNLGTCYAPWINVNSEGVAPTVVGHTLIEVAIATDALAGAVGDALQVAIDGITGVTCTDNNAGVVTCIMDAKGPATDATAGNTGWTAPTVTQGLLSTFAISAGSILTNVMGWRICNASANASTWLAVGKSTDPETDGVRIAQGVCLDCPSCFRDTLGLTKVSSQAGSNAYTVIQFKQ